MIPEIEKKILNRIDFSNKYLDITDKFVDDGLETPIFKKQDILNLFRQMGFLCKYITGGAYVVEKKYNNYKFEYRFITSKNSVDIYLSIYNKDKIIDTRVNNIGSFLRYITYNIELANKINQKFGLNSLNDLKNYIKDMIELCDEFVNEYCKEIDAGNVPE